MKSSKILGAAVGAVLAALALVGPATASAAEFHVSSPSTGLTGVGNPKFTIQSTSFTCASPKLVGTGPASGSSPTQEMHPEYSGCAWFGSSPNTAVETVGCQYKFYASTNAIDLKSCLSGGITIRYKGSFGECVAFVPNATGATSVSYSNNASLTSFNIAKKVDFKANVTVSRGICPLRVEQGTTFRIEGTYQVQAASGSAWVA